MANLEEYAGKYETVRFERNDGILQVTFHSGDGSLLWGEASHRELGHAFADIGSDVENRSAEFEVVGIVLKIGVVGARLQQQHRAVRVFRQAAGDGAAGGTGANHNHVVLQYWLLAPLIVAHGRPVFEILGYSAQKNLAVNGAGPTDHFAPGHRQIISVRRFKQARWL